MGMAAPVYWTADMVRALPDDGVDADAHEVEVWTPDVRFPKIERERILWEPAGARTPV